jgi:hypothetical protein
VNILHRIDERIDFIDREKTERCIRCACGRGCDPQQPACASFTQGALQPAFDDIVVTQNHSGSERIRKIGDGKKTCFIAGRQRQDGDSE